MAVTGEHLAGFIEISRSGKNSVKANGGLKQMQQGKEPVSHSCATWAGRGQVLMTGGVDGNIYMWNPAGGTKMGVMSYAEILQTKYEGGYSANIHTMRCFQAGNTELVLVGGSIPKQKNTVTAMAYRDK